MGRSHARNGWRRRAWHLLIAATVGAAIALPTGMAVASHDREVIHACVSEQDGAVRVVADARECRTNEEARRWNERGPQGSAGPQGPPGPAGPGVEVPDPRTAYLRCTDRAGLPIEGGSTDPNHPDAMEVFTFSHEVTDPFDSSSGLPTGKRQHKPIMITKPVDKASPLLMSVLTTGQTLPTCTLRFVRPDATTGAEDQYFTIEVRNARIVSIHAEQLYPVTDVPGQLPHAETVSFTYERVMWTWEDGGITHTDVWAAPAS